MPFEMFFVVFISFILSCHVFFLKFYQTCIDSLWNCDDISEGILFLKMVFLHIKEKFTKPLFLCFMHTYAIFPPLILANPLHTPPPPPSPSPSSLSLSFPETIISFLCTFCFITGVNHVHMNQNTYTLNRQQTLKGNPTLILIYSRVKQVKSMK